MTRPALALDRVDIRLGSEDKGLLQLAASYEGMTMASFVRKAALDVARSVLERNERISFSREEAKRILAALDQPFEPNAALSKAMKAAEAIEANSRNE